ncbi:MAG: hypothetical protein EA341_19010 [Mongoliibacter sp.]|uniref:sensor histidine kinase n=1 Tax=Mongoliibacter sp. TaxID=2022438 RepID=UPI0012EF510C|nr:ATP-binding protein [Mongoliibacter sp.]TVP42937.1 MAG: hypothetical protein EA341_19010 [Mongoliibacter sp.]
MDKIKSFTILTLTLIILGGVISIYTLYRINHFNKIKIINDQMVRYTNDIHAKVLENEIAILSFAGTFDSTFLNSIQHIQFDISRKIDSLKELAYEIDQDISGIDSIVALIDKRMDIFESSLSENPEQEQFLAFVKTHRKDIYLQFSQRIKGFNNLILNNLKTELQAKEQGLINNLNVLAVIIFAVAAIAIMAVIISFNSFSRYKIEQEENTRKLAEYKELLEEQVYQLNISNKELEQFAYVASHDLQEPLRKITSFNDLLQDQYKDVLEGDGKLYLERIAYAANRMRKLITDLLQYSRAGRQKEEEGNLKLSEVAYDVLEDLYVIIKEKSADIQVGNLPDIWGSYTDWRTVFQNLISNAVKFSKKDTPPIIRITSEIAPRELVNEHIEDPDDKVEYYHITVTDNGIGFNQEYADKIFIIFQRLYGKDIYDGTGIGLAICKKIFDKMEGTIYAESQVGKGATFHLIFPDYGENS